MTITPEIESLVQHYLASGAYRSPQSVLTKALYALQESEAMPKTNTKTTKADQKKRAKSAGKPEDVSPLLQWMRKTAGPPVDLQELRSRLAKISGSMADDLAQEREDRF